MSTALQDLQLWDRLSLHECEKIAHFIADFLPEAFRFVRVETYQVGTQSHQIALFEWKGSPLAETLPLASAYYLQLNEKEINNGVYSPCFRRTLSLSPLLE